jgi:hypothetical protein
MQSSENENIQNSLSKLRAEYSTPGFWQNIDVNSRQWAADISVGFFWAEVNRRLPDWHAEYKTLTGSDLISGLELGGFVHKSTKSILNKLSRYELKNELIKYIPTEGPPIPQIGDLVRTRIKCQYIDGVEFLSSKIEILGIELTVSPSRERQGKIEGYFAQHINILHDVTYREAGFGRLAKISCEIQIASSLASQMWETSHPLCERVRSETQSSPENWQWTPNDPRFIANQLGHMLHLADGLLVQLRDLKKQELEKS